MKPLMGSLDPPRREPRINQKQQNQKVEEEMKLQVQLSAAEARLQRTEHIWSTEASRRFSQV